MTFLEKLKKMSICCITERTDTRESKGFRGTYWQKNDSINVFLEGRIELQKNLSDIEQEATLVHELGHARCDKRDCECMYSRWTEFSRVRIELHAELYALHFLLKHHRKQALTFRLTYLHPRWTDLPYREVLQILKKRRIYKRCQEFVETYDLLFKI
ncbi:hypothetical protein KA005_51825 [bacterium]|nr:hypothetical protein [bacterium]